MVNVQIGLRKNFCTPHVAGFGAPYSREKECLSKFPVYHGTLTLLLLLPWVQGTDPNMEATDSFKHLQHSKRTPRHHPCVFFCLMIKGSSTMFMVLAT